MVGSNVDFCLAQGGADPSDYAGHVAVVEGRRQWDQGVGVGDIEFGKCVIRQTRDPVAECERLGLGLESLALGTADVGSVGVVIGYPGGQDTPRVAPVEVRDRHDR